MSEAGCRPNTLPGQEQRQEISRYDPRGNFHLSCINALYPPQDQEAFKKTLIWNMTVLLH